MNELAYRGDAVTQDLYRAVPAAHDLRRLQAVVHDIVRRGVIQSAGQLSSDVEQVPDREAFFARQHRRDAVSLNVFHGGAERAFDLAGAINAGDIRIAQD